MADLYTKDGIPLRARGDRVYNDRGDHFGYIRGDRVYGLDGRYRGTIVNDRVVYRSTQSANVSGSRGRTAGIGGSGAARRAGSALWGDEPNINP